MNSLTKYAVYGKPSAESCRRTHRCRRRKERIRVLALLGMLGLMLLSSLACHRARVHPGSLWPPVNEEVDSLSARMDYLLLTGSDIRQLQNTLDSLLAIFPCEKIGRPSRLDFFETETISDRGRRGEMLNTLLDRTDEKENPYLFNRIVLAIHTATPCTAESYRAFMNSLAYFRQIGDSLMTAMAYSNLTATMIMLSDTATAREYWTRADELFNRMGFPELSSRNKINLVIIDYNSGDLRKAVSENASLIGDSVLRNDMKVRELILRNHYLLTDSLWCLREIGRITSGRDEFSHLRGLHLSMLADWYRRHGTLDSAIRYGRNSIEEYGNVRNLNYRALIMDNYAKLVKESGDRDSTLYYVEQAGIVMDSLRASQDVVNVKNLELQRRMAFLETEEEQRSRNRTMWWVMVSMGLVICGLTAWLLLYRRHVALGYAMQKQVQEKQESERREAAKTLMVEEKNKMLEKIKSDIDVMTSGDNLSSDGLRQLKSTFAISDADSEDWSNYLQLVERINPDFIRRLKQRCPDLSANNIRLACCIYSGMTNRQIAHLTKIRAESVHQARWRLRRKLGVDSETELDKLLNLLGEESSTKL